MCYPDIPDPYKSSVLSLLKPKVNMAKIVWIPYTRPILIQGWGCTNHAFVDLPPLAGITERAEPPFLPQP